MNYTEKDEIRVCGGRIATIEKVIYEMIDSKETDRVYCYKVNINGVSGYVVYPDEIEQ